MRRHVLHFFAAALTLMAGCKKDEVAPATNGAIVGTVFSGADGNPVQGATVVTRPITSSATTDSLGKYLFSSVMAGTYAVIVSNINHLTDSVVVTVAPGQTSIANVTLGYNYASIEGTVFSSLSAVGISGATVSTDPPSTSATTDSGGHYRLSGLRVGGYYVKAISYDHIADSVEVMLSPGANVTANLSLNYNFATITGRVVSMVGMIGISSVAVTSRPATSAVSTDPNGVYTIPRLTAGSYVLTFTQSSYRLDSVLVTVAPGIIETVDMSLLYIVPTAGLLAYYPFNGDATDESGNGHNGVVVGATLAPDRFGNQDRSYRFNGVSNKITAPFADLPIGSQARTISVWARGNDSTTESSIVGYGSTAPVQYSHFYINYFAHPLPGFNGDGISYDISYWYYPSGARFSGQWKHVVATLDQGSQAKLYVNGVQAGGGGLATLNTGNPEALLNIGVYGTTSTSTRFFDGQIDDIRVYNRALSTSEIQVLYLEN